MANPELRVAAARLPSDVPGEIRALKQAARDKIGDVESLFADVETFVAQEIADIEQARAEGRDIWPEIDYDDLAAGRVGEAERQRIRRRGCAVIRNHFPHQRAREWDQRLVAYLDDNDFDRIYRGPGDDFFGSLSASRPPILPVYWSQPQMEARQDERMAAVQSFMNRLWTCQSDGRQWFDPDRNLLYPDRVRRRPPGTDSDGLGAHVDSGAIERWLHPAYQAVYRHVLNHRFDRYDPWDAAWRAEIDEYESSTMCSAFRTFQGWTALSDIPAGQGCLHTVPIPAAIIYVLLRPLLADVPEDSLCGAIPHRVLPISQTWHPLLMRALTSIPTLRAGDSVWWHCDVIHAVAPVENQQGWSNVMYIPAAPWCDRNAAYAERVRHALARGHSPGDFPDEHYEADWKNRFTADALNRCGRQGLGLGA
ncbi:DUF1479 domain-containing protein [Salinisphaera sp.]|uniref:DUF1479 domain-containing protein n=1 Tax=Salinisphaera sp. TaxID=1914330 RepID=UPI002D7919D7|nr:DUF1479 domain-containing protein [Salinisphaera sp.]HET7313941.1 DUF1479 domain-containing protein [Salinisphaera sp.]